MRAQATVGLGDHLRGLLPVVRDIESGRVEQHRAPAARKAVGDDRPFGAVVQVQRHRDRAVAGDRAEDVEELSPAVRPYSFDRGLQDYRRALLLGGGQHRLDAQVIDDVEGGDAVALVKGAVESLLEGDDGHGTRPLAGGAPVIRPPEVKPYRRLRAQRGRSPVWRRHASGAGQPAAVGRPHHGRQQTVVSRPRAVPRLRRVSGAYRLPPGVTRL